MRPQDFIIRLDASRSLGLCIGPMQECHALSILLLWIKSGPAPVSSTVFTGIDTAPSRLTVAESLQFLFAEKHTGSKLPFLSATDPCGVAGIASSLRFWVHGRHFDKDAGELVISTRPRVLFPPRTQLGRDRLCCPLKDNFLLCSRQELYLCRH